MSMIQKIQQFDWNNATISEIEQLIDEIDSFVLDTTNTIHSRALVLRTMNTKLTGETDLLLSDSQIVTDHIFIMNCNKGMT